MPPDKCVSQSGTDNAETHVCIRHVLGSDTRIGSVARQRLTGHMDTCNIQSVHRQAAVRQAVRRAGLKIALRDRS